MVVTLIGYRGCGKSSVGPLLAQLLGYECADSDQVIEQHCQRTIAAIFQDGGESEFRRIETEVLRTLLLGKNLVLAAGGGAVLADGNRQRMRAAGPVVWLKASAKELARRIGGDELSETQRPSLTGRAVVDEVADVLDVRTSIYEATATIIVNAENSHPKDIARFIYNQICESAAGDPQ